MAQIPLWIEEGLFLEDIAELIGTTPASLYVTCSRRNVSLEGAYRREPRRRLKPLQLRLPQRMVTILDGKAEEFAMSTEHLVAILIEQIVNDNLYDAVLDFDLDHKPRKKRSIPRYKLPARIISELRT